MYNAFEIQPLGYSLLLPACVGLLFCLVCTSSTATTSGELRTGPDQGIGLMAAFSPPHHLKAKAKRWSLVERKAQVNLVSVLFNANQWENFYPLAGSGVYYCRVGLFEREEGEPRSRNLWESWTQSSKMWDRSGFASVSEFKSLCSSIFLSFVVLSGGCWEGKTTLF